MIQTLHYASQQNFNRYTNLKTQGVLKEFNHLKWRSDRDFGKHLFPGMKKARKQKLQRGTAV